MSPENAVPYPQNELYYRFSSYALLPDGRLLHGGESVPIPPKELAVLSLLVAHNGQIVSHAELQEAAWSGVHVSQDSLPRCISSLRARLQSERCIQTIYKRGYRFTLPVELTPISPPARRWEGDRDRRLTPRVALPRLAILPFVTYPDVPEAFGPGVAEETMLKLNQASHPVVEVLARESVFCLAAKGLDAAAIAQSLRAEIVLTGTITALPLHFRLRAEMIRARDEVQLWVEDFLLPRELIAYADARLAKRIAARIRNEYAKPIAPLSFPGRGASDVSLAASADSAPGARPDHRAGHRSSAYELFLQSLHQWDSLEPRQMREALQGLHRAAEMDSSLKEARVRLANGYLVQAYWGYMRADIAAEQARRQIAILTESPEASHAFAQSLRPAMGWIQFSCDRDLPAALASFAAISPEDYHPAAFRYRCKFHLGLGQAARAIDLLRFAMEADPYAPTSLATLAWAYFMAGDTAAALTQIEAALGHFPDHPLVQLFSARLLAGAGSPGDALKERAVHLARRLVEAHPYIDAAHTALAYACARHGSATEARAILDRQVLLSRERFVMRSIHAPVLVALGDLDAAVEELNLAEKMRCPWFFELLHDPRLLPLHGKPEFDRLRAIAAKMESSLPAA